MDCGLGTCRSRQRGKVLAARSYVARAVRRCGFNTDDQNLWSPLQRDCLFRFAVGVVEQEAHHRRRQFPALRLVEKRRLDDRIFDDPLETQETLSEVLSELRFKRVNYKWIPSADKFSYFTLETPADSEVAAR